MEKEFEEFKKIEKWLCNETDIEATRRVELAIAIYNTLKENENND